MSQIQPYLLAACDSVVTNCTVSLDTLMYSLRAGICSLRPPVTESHMLFIQTYPVKECALEEAYRSSL